MRDLRAERGLLRSRTGQREASLGVGAVELGEALDQS